MQRFKHSSIFFLLLAAVTGLPAMQAVASDSPSANSRPIALVRANKSLGAVVLPEEADAGIKTLADYFVNLVERSSGAKLPILSEAAEAALPPETARLFIGATRRAEAAGLRIGDLPKEGYRIVTQGNAIFVIGRDAPRATGINRTVPVSQPTRWALNRLAEEQLGVRWLWPGDLGTYVPRHADFVVPSGDVAYQPKLDSRILVPNWNLRTARRDRPPTGRLTDEEKKEILTREADTIQAGIDWEENHQCGERSEIDMPSHAFNKWWERYGKTHPEYFAQPPPGEQLALYRPGSLKLRLSNPDVIEQIAKEYQAAGAPPTWPMTPNDAAGFDTSEATLAWDLPKGQPIIDIWKGNAKLTARYVTFWNLVYDRLKQINPDVELTAYAYSAYKEPPPKERPLTARMRMGIVPGYRGASYDIWKGWASVLNGGGIRLRPNWWWFKANAPHLPLEEIAAYIKFAWENRLDSIRMDSINGFWGTKGPSYYLVARLMTRPDLTKGDILAEFTSAFGKGAPKIREYLDYWQKVTTEQDNNTSSIPEVQEFFDKMKAGEVALQGSSTHQPRLLPYLYCDAVVSPAEKLLDEAEQLIGDEDPEARERVAFLRGGLEDLKATRDTVALGIQIESERKSSPELRKRFKEKSDQLMKLREELTSRHVIWGGAVSRIEYQRNIPVTLRTLKGSKKAKPEPVVGQDLNDL